jgi:membrane-bound serine protease (ClpP class)
MAVVQPGAVAYNPGVKGPTVRATLVLTLCAVAGLARAQSTSSAPAGEPASRPAWAADAPADARIDLDAGGWFAAPQRDKPLDLPAEATNAYIIPVREEITPKTYKAIERKINRAIEADADLIILDMDTWGGQVIAALDITRHIKLAAAEVPVICFGRTRCISAGAMIGIACDQIVMSDVGKFGDCAPIVMQGTLEGVEREKIESPLRTEFQESAERNGYPVALATSMVSFDQEVWLVRHRQTRELRYELRRDIQSKTVGRGDEDDATTQPTTATSVDKRPWQFVKVIVAEGKLLTMTPKQAREYSFARAILPAPPSDPYRGLKELYNITTEPTVMEDNWSERLVALLTSPVVVGLLVFLMLLFGYTEMHTPGFGVFGAIAIACLVILLCSQYLIGMANWWEIGLFVLGLVLIVLEIFVIPGFGVAGVAGILCVLIGGLAMLVPNMPGRLPIPESDWAWSVFQTGLLSVCLAFIGSLVAMGFLSKYLPKMHFTSRLILQPVAPDATNLGEPEATSPAQVVGADDTGTTLGPLHPVGTARFGQEILDVVSQGEAIGSGVRVRVIERHGNRIVVEEVS